MFQDLAARRDPAFRPALKTGETDIKRSVRVLLSVCLSVLILEAGARSALSIRPVYNHISRHRCETTYRWKWIARHRRIGADVLYPFDSHDATLGWALKPNIRRLRVFGDKTLNSNSKGIRGETEYSYEKSRRTRILILGDSFTFGDGVSDDETYAAQLQQMLPEVEVINFGVHGYGHDQMLLYWKQEGVRYRPDILILGFIPEDAERNMIGFRDFSKPRFEWNGRSLRLRNVPVPTPAVVYAQEPRRSRFVDLLRILADEISVRTGRHETKKQALTREILREIARTAKGAGATTVFVHLGDARSQERGDKTAGEMAFLKVCDDLGVRCLFLRRHFQAEKDRSGVEFRQEGHFDAAGHRLTASGIRDFLLKEGLVS